MSGRRPFEARLRAARPAALLAVALSALLVALAGCGTKSDFVGQGPAHPFRLVLDFFPNADHAAIYEAIAHGDFRAAGLNVVPQAPSDPALPLKLLAAGQADMAVSYEPELLLARDQGLKLVSVGALVQRPLTSIIALSNARVHRIADLAGKRVGTAGIPYQSAELRTMLQTAGVPPARVQEVNVGFDLIAAMISGRVAATLGGFWNYEALQLAMAHRKATVIPVDQAGVPTYDELVLVVRQDEANHRGQDIRGFLQALSRGEREVRADPAAAARLVVAADRDLDPRLQEASIRATLPAQAAPAGKPYGWQDPAAWSAFGRWMLDHSLLRSDPFVRVPPYTNEFLPGQGI